MALKSLKVLKRIAFFTTIGERYSASDDNSPLALKIVMKAQGKSKIKGSSFFAEELIVDFINANKINKEDILSIKEYEKCCVLYFYEEVQIKRPARIYYPDQFISNKF